MKLIHHSGGAVIAASFVVAFMLTILPLPDWAKAYRPEWTALVLIYWCMALPSRVGVGVGWTVGLFEDVLRGALLGQHALALAVVAFLTLKLHQRVRVFPLWQQAVGIMLLIAMSQLLVLWVKGITGHSPQTWMYWVPSLTSMLLWPWVFLVMRDLRRRFQVS